MSSRILFGRREDECVIRVELRLLHHVDRQLSRVAEHIEQGLRDLDENMLLGDFFSIFLYVNLIRALKVLYERSFVQTRRSFDLLTKRIHLSI